MHGAGFDRYARETPMGMDRSGIGRIQRRMDLGGEFRWSTCIGYTDNDGWIHSNSLTDLDTGSVARMHRDANVNHEVWDYLWQCSRETVC